MNPLIRHLVFVFRRYFLHGRGVRTLSLCQKSQNSMPG
jgi:hypothetical protein